ncbi:unnamed protein product [Owenia fusiformis]|uniref:Uncharacterized protein n=1 Tax=Owenia fusiformis TaxID=6347 RepID=A0A8S4QAJ3_OWEFU|nr:unnamed protein product [Owenia fusiformis]
MDINEHIYEFERNLSPSPGDTDRDYCINTHVIKDDLETPQNNSNNFDDENIFDAIITSKDPSDSTVNNNERSNGKRTENTEDSRTSLRNDKTNDCKTEENTSSENLKNENEITDTDPKPSGLVELADSAESPVLLIKRRGRTEIGFPDSCAIEAESMPLESQRVCMEEHTNAVQITTLSTITEKGVDQQNGTVPSRGSTTSGRNSKEQSEVGMPVLEQTRDSVLSHLSAVYNSDSSMSIPSYDTSPRTSNMSYYSPYSQDLASSSNCPPFDVPDNGKAGLGGDSITVGKDQHKLSAIPKNDTESIVSSNVSSSISYPQSPDSRNSKNNSDNLLDTIVYNKPETLQSRGSISKNTKRTKCLARTQKHAEYMGDRPTEKPNTSKKSNAFYKSKLRLFNYANKFISDSPNDRIDCHTPGVDYFYVDVSRLDRTDTIISGRDNDGPKSRHVRFSTETTHTFSSTNPQMHTHGNDDFVNPKLVYGNQNTLQVTERYHHLGVNLLNNKQGNSDSNQSVAPSSNKQVNSKINSWHIGYNSSKRPSKHLSSRDLIKTKSASENNTIKSIQPASSLNKHSTTTGHK